MIVLVFELELTTLELLSEPMFDVLITLLTLLFVATVFAEVFARVLDITALFVFFALFSLFLRSIKIRFKYSLSIAAEP
ncbi:hypothetical protein OFC37_29640, partial [Escherichia coli]|nr:hypothetical protein [Escherichia coli]